MWELNDLKWGRNPHRMFTTDHTHLTDSFRGRSQSNKKVIQRLGGPHADAVQCTIGTGAHTHSLDLKPEVSSRLSYI